MFAFREFGLKLIPLLSQSGDIDVTFLEPGGDLSEFLVFGGLQVR